ncbi:hypothetical protein GH714_034716 [Hevea brasiliensis]|uniref:Peptidase A1 domain-containing protein n=1 Tax=Hevea brasiliensis TaxID=3981 RepID=A0A6A6MFA7_HEVBR|nr:hypothetical protein GH714_034716 [Hevea brasiliensis]
MLSRRCYGFGTFGFDIHHRYSDPVKGILAIDDLPDKGSLQYYASMAHRDRLIHGRRLATSDDSTPLTFFDGNQTYGISSLGFLYYANVSVGTPGLSFLVALDTGSDLFWLPCDSCRSCFHRLQNPSGEDIPLNVYSINESSTGKKVPGTPPCVRNKTDASLLKMTLNRKLTTQPSHLGSPTYNISITKVNVGRYDSDLEFTAIFESGASFTYLNEPAYSFISESFNNQTKDKRYSFGYGLPFKYCYEISSYQDDVEVPILNLVMEGGSQFNVTDPIVYLVFRIKHVYIVLVLSKVKMGISLDVKNFMTGYRIVFDREKNVLGWKPSNCYDLSDSNTLRVNPTSPGVSPAASVNQEATTGNGSNSNVFREPLPSANQSPQLNPFIFAFITVLISFFTAV